MTDILKAITHCWVLLRYWSWKMAKGIRGTVVKFEWTRRRSIADFIAMTVYRDEKRVGE